MSLIEKGEFRQHFHAFYRVENNSIYYPDFWQKVGREFFNEWEAFAYLSETFPGKRHAVQGVEWTAMPFSFREK